MNFSEDTRKIIIFDDDEEILSICTYILEEAGWQVAVFTDCNNILERVSLIMPSVILMDNWIPQEGGIVATQLLKASPLMKHIPVIYFSANSDIQGLASAAGADDYLKKPFELDQLQRIVEKAVSGNVGKPNV